MKIKSKEFDSYNTIFKKIIINVKLKLINLQIYIILFSCIVKKEKYLMPWLKKLIIITIIVFYKWYRKISIITII